MNIPKPDINTKWIKSREAMIQYKKLLAEKNPGTETRLWGKAH